MSAFPKKLIEVSIPLKEINEACAREKSIRHGHPSTLHLWWARRPLAAARAVLFCQLVDDPSGYVDELVSDKARAKATEQELLREPEGDHDLSPRLKDRLVEKERERLHKLVADLVVWENTTNEPLFKRARKEIERSWQRHLRREGKPLDTPMPPVLDPFAGGGAIPLEAQRLGMEAHASDLNPVAVLINKAMIEIPPKFADMTPVNPEWQSKSAEEKAATSWKGAQGLAEDVRYYGNWVREEAKKRIGHLYPPYTITQELIDSKPDLKASGYKKGDKLNVIAWLWARTVPSPNPALHGKPVPLLTSFWLSKKKGQETYVEPRIENGDYRFEIRKGKPLDSSTVDSGTKAGRGTNFSCIVSGVPIGSDYIKAQGQKGMLGEVLYAVVCEGRKKRLFFPADDLHSEAASSCTPQWTPDQKINFEPRAILPPPYGFTEYGDLFSARQLVALDTLSSLVAEVHELIEVTQGQEKEAKEQTASDDLDYASSICVYLALAVSKLADSCNSFVSWKPSMVQAIHLFTRQAIPMTWDFAEPNVFGGSMGDYATTLNNMMRVLDRTSARNRGRVDQLNAATRTIEQGTIISSDPPYYDNIGYADLSDFFYVWLRRILRPMIPRLFDGMMVPKDEELIAAQYRHGGKKRAEDFFLQGMTDVAHRWAGCSSSVFPTTIYYAFKQEEIQSEGLASTGWATFLGALLEAGFSIVGTWPSRTELQNRMRGLGSNALASSIVLVCRQRHRTADLITKREFIDALEAELPDALRELQQANLSPVDLPQSAIGPGMAIFSRYSKVIKGDGQSMSVTEALQLINHELSHLLDGQVSDMDPHTRFACKWFAQHAFSTGPYGDAELIANATNVSVEGVVHAGILESAKGKARILKPAELNSNWSPNADDNLTIWEVVHHLIRLAETSGDGDCAKVLASLNHTQTSEARQLAYRLFTLCDQNKWSELAQPYNQLVTHWQDFTDLAAQIPAAAARPVQSHLDL